MAEHPVLDEIHGWGQEKTFLVAGDTDAFLTRVRPLLAAGRGESMPWNACALVLCRACAALRPRATEAFRHEVASVPGRWRGSTIGHAYCRERLWTDVEILFV